MTTKTEKQLNRIEHKLGSITGIEEKLEEVVEKEDKELKDIEKEEDDIERNLLKIGKFTVKRSHVLELARGTAGAFLGVGLGQTLGITVNLAGRLHTANVVGILFFVFLLVSLLIYKNDKSFIDDSQIHPVKYITKKITILYVISLTVVFIGLVLFNNFPGWNGLLVKTLFVGSFPAMSSAAAFTIL
jgi:hypothetical protein